MNIASRPQRILAWLAGALVILAVLAIVYFTPRRLARELSELPAPERRFLYQRTLETLRTTCAQPPGPEMAAYCRQQATFITGFPECHDACRALAARFTPGPTR